MVCIVEKTMEDKTGINIRYMVEAVRLDSQFFTNLAEPEKTETEEVCEDESDEALSTAYEENTEDSVSFDLIDAK